MKKNLTKAIAIVLSSVFVLAACSRNNDTDTTDTTNNQQTTTTTTTTDTTTTTPPTDTTTPPVEVRNPLQSLLTQLEHLPTTNGNTNPIIPGGTLRWGIQTSGSYWNGLFTHGFSSTSSDSEVLAFITEGFVWTGVNRMFNDQGLATLTYDRDARTVTLTQNREANWSDGVPVTLNDLVFTYEVIAHPDYVGPRFSAANGIPQVVGVDEFRAGEADHISGLVLSDDHRTLTIHYTTDLDVGWIVYAGIWVAPMARHHLEHIAVVDMPAHENVRGNALGFGAFILENYIPGESVHVVANPNHFRGRPILDGVVMELIDPSLSPEANVEGRFDIAAMPQSQFGNHRNPTNFSYVSTVNASSALTSFRFGVWDFDNHRVNMNRQSPINDVNLRRALAHAIDEDMIGEQLFNGLVVNATIVTPPWFEQFIDFNDPGLYFDMDKAIQILDDAGYTARDNEGYRLDLDGNRMELIWLVQGPGSAANEAANQFRLQQWSDLGIRVSLYQDRFHDFNAFNDILRYDTDDGEIDMFSHGWSHGFNPNQGWWMRPDVTFNTMRYESAQLTGYLDALAGEAAWDLEETTRIVQAIQHYWTNNVPGIPSTWVIGLTTLNNRVAGFDFARQDTADVPGFGFAGARHWGLTAEQPYRG